MSNNATWQCPMPQGKTERELQLELELERVKAENLKQEVAKMNKEQEYWQQVRTQAALTIMQVSLSNSEGMALVGKQFDYNDKMVSEFIAKSAVMYADTLVAELKKKYNDESKD